VISPESGLIFNLMYDKYIASLDRLRITSKESIVSGKLDAYQNRKETANLLVVYEFFFASRIPTDSFSKSNPLFFV
jgi:hypothetical protein